ncbi:MAG: YaaA family protein, partial [Sulfurovum sp.]|nr:YaaA family protein [Sulfurovum sp.]
ILDLRAGFYDKFYRPTKPYTTLKFIKEGKVVSHWAKAYRGLVLREIAKTGVKCIDAFMRLPIEGLRINEIQIQKNRTEIIYDIEL